MTDAHDPPPGSTADSAYTDRLTALSGARWKRLLRPLDPYLLSLRRRHLGRTLDIGCGIGRNLAVLGNGSVGVDHNKTSVREARALGLEALTVEEFEARSFPHGSFDSLLISHVLEHLNDDEASSLLESYLPYLRSGGRVVLFCPQERGFASDATHVRWVTDQDLLQLCRAKGLRPRRSRSFPLPRQAGRLFVYNEFQLEAVKP